MPLEERILLEQRLLGKRRASAKAATIPRRGHGGPCEPSFAQSRLWLVEHIDPVPGNYNISEVYRIRGPLNAEALEAALDALVSRHEVLRTRLVTFDGVPRQVIDPHQSFELKRLELRGCPDDAREPAVDEFIRGITSGGFDLSADCMLRAGLARVGPQESVLAITLHHIASDGWSLSVLDRELEAFYAAFDRGLPGELRPLPLQYSDYSEWQRGWLSGAVLEGQLGYWREQLAGLLPLQLPVDRARPAHLSYRGAIERFTLPAELVTRFRARARECNATLYMALLAAFQVLLMRYTGQDDIAVGSPIAGRNRTELEGLIGFFVNTMVMRGDLSGNPDFPELLTRTRKRALDAYAHQDLPFEKLVEELKPERDTSRNPLFQVMFAFQNTPETELRLPGLETVRTPLHSGNAKFDLSLSLTEANGRLEGAFEYSTDLFDAATIERMVGHFTTLLEGIVDNPACRIGELPLLTDVETHRLLVEWNSTAADYPRDLCVHRLFEQRAAASPEAIAVVCGQRRLTYGELNVRANRLAHWLRTREVGPDVLVGLCVERSVEMVVGMLGIVKAGGAYVPLDPGYPAQRLAFMLADAGVAVLVTQHALRDMLPPTSAELLCLDAPPPELEQQPTGNPDPLAHPDHLAYLIYTSGSTGTPKGVMALHRGVTRLVGSTDYVQLGPSDFVAQLSNVAFDAATFEVWGALANGSRLVVIPREVALDPAKLAAELRGGGISTLFLTTALFNEVVRFQPGAFAGVKQVLFGGEAVDPRWVRECLSAGAPGRLLHMYGPTETVTFATWHSVGAVAPGQRTIPIGRPIANTLVYVLDRHRQPVPVGVAGELYIGGDGLARGYWGQSELTAECFVPDPYAQRAGATMYRTGDRARYLPDGNIEFLGRLDHQLKLRGFRVEPGEIEVVLARHAQVREALVLLREDVPGDKRLVAYVVAGSEPLAAADLRAFLKPQLPDYMLPAAFVLLPAFPLTPNGKIDRGSLPAPPGEQGERNSDLTEPRDNIERHLVKIWENLLKPGPISVHDNFFDLGGHSLLAVQLMDRIDKAFHRRLPLDTLWFRGSTIKAQAALLRDEYQFGGNPEVVAMKSGSRRPLFVVHTMGGNLFHYYELVRHLDPEQAVYGLQARGVYGAGSPDHTIESIAARCVDAMRTVQPEGPYLVAGFSSGGVVAFEMGQQLAAAGQPVALLALIDTYAPRAKASQWWIDELTALGRRKLSLRQVQELAYFSVLHSLHLDRLRRLRTVGEAHRWAHWSYRPKPYPHPIEFFIAKDSADRGGADNLGWIRWVDETVHIHRLPGSHGDLVKSPVVEELAAR